MDEIRKFVVLTILISVFDRDIRVIESVAKAPAPFVELLNNAIERIKADMAEIKRYFWREGVKVFDPVRKTDAIHAEYLRRGQRGAIEIDMAELRDEIAEGMRRYLLA